MLLVIPLIEIKNGRCLSRVTQADGSHGSDDPVAMARLWRQENAKFLHVSDLGGAGGDRAVNLEAVRRMASSVDIPIEFSGGLRTAVDVKNALAAGVHRVVIGTMFIDRPEEAEGVLKEFGDSRIVLGLDVVHDEVMTKGVTERSGLTPLSVALNAKEMGFRRLVYRDATAGGTERLPDLGAVRTLAEKSALRVTVSGGVGDLEDLLKVQELEPSGVDSVIIGRAFYENRFSCEGLWRLCEAGNYPYTAKV